MGTDLLINLLASFIWFVIGYAFYHFSRFQRVIKPTTRLWNIKDYKNLIICAATSTKTDTGHYVRPATGIGQLRALGYAVESLSKAYDLKIQNILLSDDQVQKQIEKDIIILGGPKNNIIARLFLDKLRTIKEVADQDGNTIKWILPNEEKEFNGSRKNKEVVKDYGLIIRTKNPFTSAQNRTSVCLFTGCHTYGTIAAAKYFTNFYIKKAGIFSKLKENIFLLVECDVVDGFPVAIKLIKEHEF